jgi:hypothetical protein
VSGGSDAGFSKTAHSEKSGTISEESTKAVKGRFYSILKTLPISAFAEFDRLPPAFRIAYNTGKGGREYFYRFIAQVIRNRI